MLGLAGAHEQGGNGRVRVEDMVLLGRIANPGDRDEVGFTRAAARMHVVQSSLSACAA